MYILILTRTIQLARCPSQVLESVLQPPLGDLQGVLVGSGTSVSRVNTLLTVTRLLDAGKSQ